jgi:nitrogen fixation protein NifX
MAHRVAVASTDGKVVNQHFGHAEGFHVFDVVDGGFSYVETREVRPVCGPDGHEDSGFDAVVETLKDCEAIFVARIGPGAARYMISKGVRVFEAPYAIEEVLENVVRNKLLAKG